MPHSPRVATRTTAPRRLTLAATLALTLCGAASVQAQTELVIATVNNGHMIEMQKLSKNFEQANPEASRQAGGSACVSMDLANIVRFGLTDRARERFKGHEHTHESVAALLAEPTP